MASAFYGIFLMYFQMYLLCVLKMHECCCVLNEVPNLLGLNCDDSIPDSPAVSVRLRICTQSIGWVRTEQTKDIIPHNITAAHHLSSAPGHHGAAICFSVHHTDSNTKFKHKNWDNYNQAAVAFAKNNSLTSDLNVSVRWSAGRWLALH